MKEYTSKQIRQLQSNTYTLKVTKCKLYFTAKFKEDFWIRYQAGDAPRKILTDLGYDISLFGQKQIDSLVQRIKQQALSGEGFREGENHDKRLPEKEPENDECANKAMERMQHELLYLRQEVEFIKKIIKADSSKRRG